MEKISNNTLRDAGLELIKRNGTPLKNISSPGRSMIYAMPNGETVRVRTCNDHVLIVTANEPIPSKNTKMNIEGTDWLLIVMPDFKQDKGNIIAYHVPVNVAVEAIKSSHQHWQDSNSSTRGNTKTWRLQFHNDFTDKDSRIHKHNYSDKWAIYKIDGHIKINEIELAHITSNRNVLQTGFDDLEDNFEQLIETITPFFQFIVGKVQIWEMKSTSFNRDMSEISQQLNLLLPTVKPKLVELSQTFTPYIEALENHLEIVDAFEATGWLPHRSTSHLHYHLLNENKQYAYELLSNHYQNNWNDILQNIESNISEYNIDFELEEAFNEIISAHRAGYYRCVCRAIFPEIERVVLSYPSDDNENTLNPAKRILKFIEKEYIKEFIKNDPFDIVAFKTSIEHLYKNTKGSSLSDFEHNPVPNRHATVHGLISYSTMQHSLNSIIMADNIFSIFKQNSRLYRKCETKT